MKRIVVIASIVACLVFPRGLSQSAPLIASSWTPLGAAATVNGFTDYTEPTSGRITDIAAHPSDPNIIYIAAAGGGVWKTTDGGASWVPSTDTQGTLFMGAIALAPSNPSIIYAGTGEANMGPSKARNFRDNIYYGIGLLKSGDAGNTWMLLGTAQFTRRTVSKIIVDPTNPNTVYVAIGALATNGLPGNTGIWKSTDGGVTWSNTTATISTTAAFSDLVMDPSDQQILYAAAGVPGGNPVNGVYKTTNAGTSWAPTPGFPFGDTRLGRIALAISPPISPGSPRRVYAAVALPGPPNSMTNSLFKLLRTTDGGATWELLLTSADKFCPSGAQTLNYLGGAGDYHNTLAVDPSNPGNVYAAGLCIIRSTDGGDTWDPIPIAPGTTDGPHRDHHALVFDAGGSLLDGNDGGIWRLDDPNLVVWSNLNGDLQITPNLQITQFVGIAVHPTDAAIAYGGTQDTGTVMFQGGLQWSRLLRGDGGASAVSVSNPMRVYQVTRISSTSSIFRRSDDGGQIWVPKDPDIPADDHMNFYFPVVMDPMNSNRLLLGTTRVFETLDGGDVWVLIGQPGVNGWPQCIVCDNVDSVAVAPSDANTIYASAGGHIFVTFNHGGAWQQRDIAGLANPHFRSLLVDPANNLIAYVVRDRFDGGHVFRTINGGQTWTDISGNLPNLPVNTIALDPRFTPRPVYVGTDIGVYASTEQGASWIRFGAGLPNAQVADLKLNTTLNILAAGTHGRGVWEVLLGP